jgi:hypothetical protein
MGGLQRGPWIGIDDTKKLQLRFLKQNPEYAFGVLVTMTILGSVLLQLSPCFKNNNFSLTNDFLLNGYDLNRAQSERH